MFLYEDNRFHFSNMSFCLPDNVYLNTNCDEYNNCIELRPNGADFRIIIFGDYKENGAKQFFSAGEAEECYCWVGEISNVTIGSLTGYSISYKSTYNAYIEYSFDIGAENDLNILGIRIQGKEPTDMDQILRHKAVVDLLHSLLKVSL